MYRAIQPTFTKSFDGTLRKRQNGDLTVAILTSKVNSLPDFIRQVVTLRDKWEKDDINLAKQREDEDADPLQTWFRGQESAAWRLIPKMYRQQHFNENEIRTEYKLRAFQLMSESRIPSDDKEWYFLMQHFGAPTRLLDWTDGALIALYFAVKSHTKYANSAVWMLDPTWFNDDVLNKTDESNYVSGVLLPSWPEAEPWFPKPFEQVLHVGSPVAIDPPHVARRVSVQRSRFTIHGRSKRGLEAFARNVKGSRLVKFVIPKKVGTQILKDLSTCGIVETSVFPDLEGLSRELETKWTQLKS